MKRNKNAKILDAQKFKRKKELNQILKELEQINESDLRKSKSVSSPTP